MALPSQRILKVGPAVQTQPVATVPRRCIMCGKLFPSHSSGERVGPCCRRQWEEERVKLARVHMSDVEVRLLSEEGEP